MIRVIVTTVNAGAAANVGGPVHVQHKTFDVSAPALEAFMSEKLGSYTERSIAGVEVIEGDPA